MSTPTPDNEIDEILEDFRIDLPGTCCNNEDCDGWHPDDDIREKKAIAEAKSALTRNREVYAVRAQIDVLQRQRGVLGKYNCQHGGTSCEFQINCHRLIEVELAKLTAQLIKLEGTQDNE